MAITLFGEAGTPTDNGAQAGPGPVAVTPPASMTAGDLVVVFAEYKDDGLLEFIELSEYGGQKWSMPEQSTRTTVLLMRVFWCRFNGTWSANPSWKLSDGVGTAAFSVKMLVFRPSASSKFWVPDIWPVIGSFAAPASPFTVTITGVTSVTQFSSQSHVVIAAWASVDDNTWGSLSGTGWSKTGLTAQLRNTTGSDMSMTWAYNIQTTSGASNNVSQNQATLGGDAGCTYIMAFTEIDLPSGGGGSGSQSRIQTASFADATSGTSVAATFGSGVTSGHTVIGSVHHEITSRPTFPITDNQSNEYVPVQCVSSALFLQTLIGFFRPNITNAPTTVTLTLSGSAIERGMILHEIRGIDELDVHSGQYNTAVTADFTIEAGSATLNESNEYVFAHAAYPGNSDNRPEFVWTAWGGSTVIEFGLQDGVANFCTGEKLNQASGSLSVTATIDTERDAMCMMMTFKAAAAAVASFLPIPPRLGQGLLVR